MKKKILISASPFCEHNDLPLKLLRKNNIDYDLNPKKRKLTENEIIKLIKFYDGLIADVEPLNKKVLAKSKNLKIISRVGIGVSNIDLKYAKKKKIVITNTPDAPTPAVVELNLGLIFALIRNVIIHSTDLKKGNWKRLFGLRLPFLKIGIFGLGRIGSGLAKKLLKIGCKKIYYNDLYKKKINSKIIFKSKNYIFKNCDLLCLTLPETIKTKNFLNKKIFKIMKRQSFIVNTSRGELINEQDLLNFLKRGYFSGVALDVFNYEPYRGKLIKFNRCILTPHIGSHTIDCRNKMELEATKDLINFFKKKPIINKVN
tara:strand:- start:5434 stop:6378 length:945 start_codon:yes stop_codon:yes gene_type:complete